MPAGGAPLARTGRPQARPPRTPDAPPPAGAGRTGRRTNGARGMCARQPTGLGGRGGGVAGGAASGSLCALRSRYPPAAQALPRRPQVRPRHRGLRGGAWGAAGGGRQAGAGGSGAERPAPARPRPGPAGKSRGLRGEGPGEGERGPGAAGRRAGAPTCGRACGLPGRQGLPDVDGARVVEEAPEASALVGEKAVGLAARAAAEGAGPGGRMRSPGRCLILEPFFLWLLPLSSYLFCVCLHGHSF